MVENQGSERRRLINLLEMADIKLAGVVSDIFGVTGRAILRALIPTGQARGLKAHGDQTAVEMRKHARGNLRRKRGQLIDAPCSLPWAGLAGELAEHQRHMLARVAADEADIAALDQQIADRLAPHAAQMAQLMTVPGIDWVFAATIIAEIGLDMSVFPSAGHLAVWTGACPRQQPERRPAQTGRRPHPQSFPQDRPVQRRHCRLAQARQLLQGQVPQAQEPPRRLPAAVSAVSTNSVSLSFSSPSPNFNPTPLMPYNITLIPADFHGREAHQYMCCPPFTESVEPVMKSASSATRNKTVRAMSSALPSRPTGIRAMIFSRTSAGTARTISVST